MALDHIDRSILSFLFKYHGWINTNQIADRVGIAWQTAERHLEKLNRLGYVARGKKYSTIFWRAQ